ncbi:MAG TPA: hypothetical protein VNQ32_08365 [Steroidobacteraceae bacterium]|nr:hypothetical protein [Steroidobacteraceae bacterium]
MSHTHHWSSRRIAHLAILLLAVAAFGVQQWAVASHWHAPAAAATDAAAVQPASDEAPYGGRGQPHPDCQWCQAASHAAAAAPPTHWVGLPALITLSSIRPSAGTSVAVAPPLSWAWHSRGPPAARSKSA